MNRDVMIEVGRNVRNVLSMLCTSQVKGGGEFAAPCPLYFAPYSSASSLAIRSPIQAMHGTAMLLPRALYLGPSFAPGMLV